MGCEMKVITLSASRESFSGRGRSFRVRSRFYAPIKLLSECALVQSLVGMIYSDDWFVLV